MSADTESSSRRLYAWDITIVLQQVPAGCRVTVDTLGRRVYKDPTGLVALTAEEVVACCQVPLNRALAVLGPAHAPHARI